MTAPVRRREYAELAEELQRIGYNLRQSNGVVRHHERRRQMARHLAALDTGRIAAETN